MWLWVDQAAGDGDTPGKIVPCTHSWSDAPSTRTEATLCQIHIWDPLEATQRRLLPMFRSPSKSSSPSSSSGRPSQPHPGNSSPSSSSARRSSQSSEERKPGPVNYKLWMDPQKPVYCSCERLCDSWTSWTDENPGRGFFACQNRFTREIPFCKFYKWAKPDHTPAMKGLIIALRDKANKANDLKGENSELTKDRRELTESLHDARATISVLETKNKRLKLLLQDKLKNTSATCSG
ncbi:hypothetical protein ACP70R_046365 [Stipagrostis hirtigluma subsp. patula]